MTDAEKVAVLIDAMQHILSTRDCELTDQQRAGVALSYAFHALQLVGELPHPPLSDEALAYAEQVVAPRIAKRLG